MKRVLVIVGLLILPTQLVVGQQEILRVYDKEDIGAGVEKPAFPAFGELKSIPHLPDPFLRSAAAARRSATSGHGRPVDGWGANANGCP
jgi:hypothetical protein